MRLGRASASIVGFLLVGGSIWSAARAAESQSPLGTRPPSLIVVGSPQSAISDGFPITSEVVIRNCATCHQRDAEGRMGRISFIRKTPEGWQSSIRRMVSLHGVRLEPEAAREIVRYLATQQGLAPEELAPGRFEVERRMDPFTYTDAQTERTCTACHSMGRVITERRTEEEWKLLIATHRALYPLVDRQAFYEAGGPGAGSASGDRRQPVERAIAHLAEAYPLETSEWMAWSANVRPARLDGRWMLSGTEPGRGPVYGIMELRPVPGTEDEFTSTTRYVYADEGTVVTRSGRSIVYAGHQWRGRSAAAAGADELREVMSIERGWGEMNGRWFTGEHDEFGMDVRLRRITAEPAIMGVHPGALRSGGPVQEVRVFGANLDANFTSDMVDLGPGVTVREVVGASPDGALLRVEVAPEATAGSRDVYVGNATLTNAFVVYDRVDAIRITPQTGLSRVGGIAVPKQFQQFEAIGYHRGADGRAGTDDDIRLGPVPVDWGIEEYPVTFDDDDVEYVGSIDARGLFTPNVDGPNPERSGNRNNIGEVWVIGTYRDEVDRERTLSARAYLIVTAPIHLRWDDWPGQ
jgi:quinohemoprotein amine dehydrogenase